MHYQAVALHLHMLEHLKTSMATKTDLMVVDVFQLNSLGLLPTHASDWVSSLPPPQVLIGCIFDKFTC
jgi:hypothetical protein